jgi:hypothetical protein
MRKYGKAQTWHGQEVTGQLHATVTFIPAREDLTGCVPANIVAFPGNRTPILQSPNMAYRY